MITKPVSARAMTGMIRKWLDEKMYWVADQTDNDPARTEIVFDEKALLERLQGDRDIARRLIDVFLTQLAGDLSSLQQALERRDAASIGLLAHRIKGAAANASAYGLQQRAREVELAAGKGDWDELADGVAQVCGQAEVFISSVNRTQWIKNKQRQEDDHVHTDCGG